MPRRYDILLDMTEQSKVEKDIRDLTEIVVSIKDYMVENMATKAEMNAGFASVDVRFEQVNGKIDGIGRRIDSELERTLQLEDRVSKVEVEVFPELAK